MVGLLLTSRSLEARQMGLSRVLPHSDDYVRQGEDVSLNVKDFGIPKFGREGPGAAQAGR